MNKTKEIIEFVDRFNLEFITLEDGTEYIIGDDDTKAKDFLNFAHCQRLVPCVIMKDTNVSDQWKLTPYFVKDRVRVADVVYDYFDNLDVVSFSVDYDKRADKYVQNCIERGASPTEIGQAISDTEAIKKMYSDNKLGFDEPLSLVMDKGSTEHFIVPENQTKVRFKNISLAIALAEPTTDLTHKAVEYIKSGKNIPNVPGMCPEDVVNVIDEDFSEKYHFSICEKDGKDDWYQMGPFVVLDHEGYIGYAYRISFDNKVWFWQSGKHSNIDIPRLEDYWNKSNWYIYEKANETQIAAWMAPVRKIKTNAYENLIKL